MVQNMVVPVQEKSHGSAVNRRNRKPWASLTEGHHYSGQVFIGRGKFCWTCPKNGGLGMFKRATIVDTLKQPKQQISGYGQKKSWAIP